MSFYVRRVKGTRVGFTGPIRSERQAHREAAAWEGEGFEASVLESNSVVRAEVRRWERRQVDARAGVRA